MLIRIFVGIVLGVMATGCANYAAVAKLNGDNQTILKALDRQLSLSVDDRARVVRGEVSDADLTGLLAAGPKAQAKELTKEFGSSREAALRAQSRAGIAEIEAKRRFAGDEEAEKRYRNAELARLQTEFNTQVETEKAQQKDLAALYVKLVEGVRAIHRNGEDIQKYLELSVIERLYTDVRGLDPTTLKGIGEDLKTLSGRVLAPARQGE